MVLLLVLFVGWCVSLMPDPQTRSPSSFAPPPTKAAAVPQITVKDMQRERNGTYGRHKYFVEKHGQTVVLFTPALARDDAVVIGAIRQVPSLMLTG
jgi:hypothetical protein